MGSSVPQAPAFVLWPIWAALSSIVSLKLFCGVRPLFGVPEGFQVAPLEGVPAAFRLFKGFVGG